MPSTLIDAFERAATSSSPVRFLDANSVLEETTWVQIWDAAGRRAAAMQARGVAPGDRVALLGFTSQAFMETVFAVIRAGATVVVLPLPMRLASKEAFIDATRARLAAAHAKLLVLDDFFVAQYEPGDTDPPTATMADLASGSGFEDITVRPEDLAVLQFTSGSTAAPRAVRLHHGAITSNIFAISDGVRVDDRDSGLVWLPMYHDMGLIGGLFWTASNALPMTFAAPQAFLSRPGMWLEAASTFGSTLTVAPNFAYALATRALTRGGDLDLSSLRVALCGAEPIDPDVMDHFTEAGVRHGMRPTVPFPCYGLAESTLAVTFGSLDDPLRVDRVDRATLEHERLAVPAAESAKSKGLVGLGFPLRGISVRVVDADGRPCQEREVGDVLIAGSSLMQGYDGQPEVTAQVLRDGWLHTGDQGYTADGELFLCGRTKDLIIVGGRNIWPEDVEAAAQQVTGVRAGNAIAFGIAREGSREAVVVVAETKLDAGAAQTAASEVAAVVRDHIGMAPRQVLLLAPGELPKTSSGKLQRNLTRSRYLNGELSAVAAHGNGV